MLTSNTVNYASSYRNQEQTTTSKNRYQKNTEAHHLTSKKHRRHQDSCRRAATAELKNSSIHSKQQEKLTTRKPTVIHNEATREVQPKIFTKDSQQQVEALKQKIRRQTPEKKSQNHLKTIPTELEKNINQAENKENT